MFFDKKIFSVSCKIFAVRTERILRETAAYSPGFGISHG